jgi:hypothetical protein
MNFAPCQVSTIASKISRPIHCPYVGLPQKASDLATIGFQRYLIIICAMKYD